MTISNLAKVSLAELTEYAGRVADSDDAVEAARGRHLLTVGVAYMRWMDDESERGTCSNIVATALLQAITNTLVTHAMNEVEFGQADGFPHGFLPRHQRVGATSAADVQPMIIPWCYKTGCLARATHHLYFQAWPADGVYDVRTCMNGIIPLPLCLDHAKSADPSEGIFDGRTWTLVLREFKRRGQSPPSFATVKLFPRPGVPAAPKPSLVKH